MKFLSGLLIGYMLGVDRVKFTEEELEKIKKERMEQIDRWLDSEYGCSYTRLEELHDFAIEQDMKHQEEKDKEIERLNNIIEEKDKRIHLTLGYMENAFSEPDWHYVYKILDTGEDKKC